MKHIIDPAMFRIRERYRWNGKRCLRQAVVILDDLKIETWSEPGAKLEVNVDSPSIRRLVAGWPVSKRKVWRGEA